MKHNSVPVSVIIPCYNVSKTLERTLQSVVEQTFLPSEVILVNDHSYDDNKTLNIIYKFKEEYSNLFDIK